jgi:Rrf2 family protein
MGGAPTSAQGTMVSVRISAKTDYGIRVLLELAADTANPVTCEAVASSQQIPYRFLKSVFADLRRAGLVVSQRGCEGGYWLARDAAAISVYDVVRAVDGHVFQVRGENVGDLQYEGPAAHLRQLWRQAEKDFESLLTGTTIASLLIDGPHDAPGIDVLAAAAS